MEQRHKIIGFSGSPIRNSNTDRLLEHVLESTGLEYEVIKLSKYTINPCSACNGCTKDNHCVVKDDFQAIAEKVKEADAIVFGAYTPHSLIDGFSKALLERFFSFRNGKTLLKDKYMVSIVASVYDDVRENAHRTIISEAIAERMNHVACLDISGSNPCSTCDDSTNCDNSTKTRLGTDIELNVNNLIKVESMAAWTQGADVGRQLNRLINNEEKYVSPQLVDDMVAHISECFNTAENNLN